MESSLLQLLAQGFLYLALLVYTIYTLIFMYHWFTYGSSKSMSTTALITFLIGTSVLFATLFISFTLL